jgi:hypothetical protein
MNDRHYPSFYGSIYEQIANERIEQDKKWGGSSHDDCHQNWEWIAYITKHAGKAVMWPWNGPTFRCQMVRVAALAVAAIEWYDRGKYDR